jgi:medium-chain acyl-[acyl-carrier-protein] hydrolase
MVIFAAIWHMSLEVNMNKWLTFRRPNPRVEKRLFCFPYSGAGASSFRTWADTFPETIEVVPVQFPGRENRLAEPLYTQLEPLIEDTADALLPYLDKPFAFFGHSMGALVSFELARHLRRRHEPTPQHLIVSGHNAPQETHYEPPIHELPDDEFMEKIREFNGTSESLLANPELKELVLPIIRADFTACETYSYADDTPLDCPISACAGLQDSYLNREGLEAWAQQTTEKFALHLFPGDHFYLTKQRPLLLRILVKKLLSL